MSLKEKLNALFDVFSLRNQLSEKEYRPDKISDKLRARILLLYREIISGQGSTYFEKSHPFWSQMFNSLQNLYGRFNLSDDFTPNNVAEGVFHFLQTCTADNFFDFIELSFKVEIARQIMHDENDMVDSINEIFRIEDSPYKLTHMVVNEEKSEYGNFLVVAEYPKIIRVEDGVIYKKAIKPALSVLRARHFQVANAEFRGALNEYKRGNYSECLTKCGSSLESVLKVICEKKQWSFNQQDTLNPLIQVVVGESTLPPSFKSVLEHIGVLRNKQGSAHGGGAKIRAPKRHIAEYGISSTAAAIVLLVHETDTK